MINEIVLASASPRRKEILEMLGIHVILRPGNSPEDAGNCTDPEEMVKRLAEQKAMAVPRTEQELVLAADTIVTIDGRILGKPVDRNDAMGMLCNLSGREHSVFTGFCLLKGNKRIIGAEETKVRFRTLSQKMISDYLDTGEPFDKAGAYGIQGKGCLLICGITGDYFNVVGLPVSRIMAELEAMEL